MNLAHSRRNWSIVNDQEGCTSFTYGKVKFLTARLSKNIHSSIRLQWKLNRANLANYIVLKSRSSKRYTLEPCKKHIRRTLNYSRSLFAKTNSQVLQYCQTIPKMPSITIIVCMVANIRITIYIPIDIISPVLV